MKTDDASYSTISCALPCVVWHADDQAIFIHLDKPVEFMVQEDGGNIILDLNWNDRSDVIGIEVLSEPTGMEQFDPDLPGETWVLIGKAWERAQIARRDAKGAHRGEFTVR